MEGIRIGVYCIHVMELAPEKFWFANDKFGSWKFRNTGSDKRTDTWTNEWIGKWIDDY